MLQIFAHGKNIKEIICAASSRLGFSHQAACSPST